MNSHDHSLIWNRWQRRVAAAILLCDERWKACRNAEAARRWAAKAWIITRRYSAVVAAVCSLRLWEGDWRANLAGAEVRGCRPEEKHSAS